MIDYIIENNVILIMGGVLLGLYLVRKIFPKQPVNDYRAQMNEILNNEEYKVKGRYD